MMQGQTENLLSLISAEKDGGRAFPFESSTGGVEFTNHGMTMRDYLAARAMVAVPPPTEYLGYRETEDSYRLWANRCVRMADTLMVALGKKP